MWKTILLYSVIMALLIFLLKMVEYSYVIKELSIEFYIGLVAVLFTAVGIWGGLKLTTPKKIVITTSAPFIFDEQQQKQLGISKRELDVLELMATGLSNQEIADRLFVSLNTIKTHSASLFVKLDVKRRTQAVQRAKELKLIP